MKLVRESEGVPTVTSDTERAARFPEPVTGQKVYNLQRGLQRWNGSAWIPVGAVSLSVMDFGAVGDGVTDDAAAINAAVDAAAAVDGTVVFPGRFRVAAPVELKDGVRYVGVGKRGGGIIVGQNSIKGFRNNTGARITVAMENITIETAAGVTGDIGLDLTDVDRSHFREVRVWPESGSGFAKGCVVDAQLGAYHNAFVDCIFRGNTYGYHLTGSVAGEGANSTRIIGGEARADGSTAIYHEYGNDVVVLGVSIEGTTVKGYHAVGAASRLAQAILLGVRFEHSGGGTTGIHFATNTQGCVALGCLFPSGIVTRILDEGQYNLADALSQGVGPGLSRGNVTLNNGAFRAALEAAQIGQENFAIYGKSGATVEANPRFSVTASRIKAGAGGASATDLSLQRAGTKEWKLEAGRLTHVWRSFANADTTPDVSDGHYFACANAGATTITTFDGGVDGQEIVVLLDANTTIAHGTSVKLAGGVNIVGTANDTITLVMRSSVWYETARSVNG